MENVIRGYSIALIDLCNDCWYHDYILGQELSICVISMWRLDMKQHEAVILAMKQNGGYATLGQLYQTAPKISGSKWGTKTPFATIRRIVQEHDEFFKIRSG